MVPRLYGIKNCDSTRKAAKFLKAQHIDYTFIDFKETPVDEEVIQRWLDDGATVKQLFNSRSTTYRSLKLKELDLDDQARIEWMAKENLLIKRPVFEHKKSVLVGYDEERYRRHLIT